MIDRSWLDKTHTCKILSSTVNGDNEDLSAWSMRDVRHPQKNYCWIVEALYPDMSVSRIGAYFSLETAITAIRQLSGFEEDFIVIEMEIL